MSEPPKNGGFAERTILRPARAGGHPQGHELRADRRGQFADRFRGLSVRAARPSSDPWPERLDLIAANVLAWMVAVSGSYVMNSYVTFAAESGRKLRWKCILDLRRVAGIAGRDRQHRDARGRGRIHAGRGGEARSRSASASWSIFRCRISWCSGQRADSRCRRVSACERSCPNAAKARPSAFRTADCRARTRNRARRPRPPRAPFSRRKFDRP